MKDFDPKVIARNIRALERDKTARNILIYLRLIERKLSKTQLNQVRELIAGNTI